MKDQRASEDVVDATVMCAAELVENAVKYGNDTDGVNTVLFDVSVKDGVVCVSVSNSVRDQRDLDSLRFHIDQIKKSSDPSQLYIGRLRDLIENPKGGISQLGLYRIAYEGEFSLDYRYENHVIKVVAFRHFDAE